MGVFAFFVYVCLCSAGFEHRRDGRLGGGKRDVENPHTNNPCPIGVQSGSCLSVSYRYCRVMKLKVRRRGFLLHRLAGGMWWVVSDDV